DEMGAQIGNAAGARDAVKWSANAHNNGTYLSDIASMKNWLQSRVNYLDSRIPARPTVPVASGVIAPGTTITVTGAGVMRYTLDGTDPRATGGGIAPGALTYSGPITISQTTVLTIRRQFGAVSVFPEAANVTWSAPERRV